MPLRRPESHAWAVALLAAILGIDLAWAALAGSSGSVLYGLVDEPAHLATCGLCLLALRVALGRPLPAPFVIAALVGSVAIDLDHLPGYLGSHVLSGAEPRPHTHSASTVAVLIAVGLALRDRGTKVVALGLGFGVASHLLRDLGTGPGVPLLWPLSGNVVSVPYAVLAASLVALTAVAAGLSWPGARRGRVGASAAALILALAVLTVGGDARAAGGRVEVGAFVPGGDRSPDLLRSFGSQIGKEPEVVLTYKDWRQAPFVHDQLDGIAAAGAVPLVTWEPWLPSGRGVSLAAIARGRQDGLLRRAALDAASWGRPVMLRFAQEMNGIWFPWSGHPSRFRQAWRHIHRVFDRAGADNVIWVWTPYVSVRGKLPFRGYYPGSKWVDWVGFDGMNWGGGNPWRTPGQLFAATYRTLAKLAPRKPMMIAETGCGEGGNPGAKARWVRTLMSDLVPRMPKIRSVVFWSADDPRGDLRVDSSSAALEALVNALNTPTYGG